LYAYVRNNPLKNTDRNGRDCFQGLSSCASYLIGGLKAAVNIVPGIATLLNHGINRLTGSSIPDAPTLQPANVDEAQGSEAFNVISALSPIAEIGTATSVITYGAEATAASEGPTVGETVYRVWGDQSGPYGKSWTPVDPETVQNYRSAAGLPDWNSGTQLTKGTLTNTEGVTVQPATPLHGNPGGLKEYVVPDPKSQVDIKSIKLKENPPIN
jgi:hypothetical protein